MAVPKSRTSPSKKCMRRAHHRMLINNISCTLDKNNNKVYHLRHFKPYFEVVKNTDNHQESNSQET